MVFTFICLGVEIPEIGLRSHVSFGHRWALGHLDITKLVTITIGANILLMRCFFKK